MMNARPGPPLIMTSWQLIRRGLSHHWRIHLAVALGVMAGTAVLTGALLVGDSVRGSLRGLALDRLGRIDEALVAPYFFREQLADELAGQDEFKQHFDAALPAIMLRASLANPDRDKASGVKGFSGRVTLWGVDERFWKTGHGRPEKLPSEDADELVLNRRLAEELHVEVGDQVILRLPQVSLVPRESTLGTTAEFVEQISFQVADIIPARGLGRFGLHPNQQLPFNAFTTLQSVQRMLDQNSRVNAILVAGKERPGDAPPSEADGVLDRIVRPRLSDFGVRLELIERGPLKYFDLTTDRMLFDEAVADAALTALAEMQARPALTYLANLISAGPPPKDPPTKKPVPRSIPYSTVTGINFDKPVAGKWTFIQGDIQGGLKDNEIVLNEWAFNSLNKELGKDGPMLKAGDEGSEISLTFFEPEHSEGERAERSVTFRLKAVVALSEESTANDSHFTPTIAGVTDPKTLEEWEAPFEYHSRRIRRNPDDDELDDEAYYQKYKLTPKAFVNLRTGQRLWGSSRFGSLTSIRIPAAEGRTREQIAKRLEDYIAGATEIDGQQFSPQQVGFTFQPIKRQALEASSGTTPFDVLFVGFSMFIIAAAVMLVALLFRLGVETRAEEVGTLLAGGWSGRQVRRLLAGEGLIVAAVGGLLGTAAGAAYAALMLYGLRTWWVEAVTTPFLELHTTWLSFVIGYFSGVLISFAAVWWTLRRMRHLSVRRLLAGQATEESDFAAARPRVSRWVAIVSLVLAGVLVVVASMLGGEAQAGAFFGSGFAVLTGLLALLWGVLRGGSRTSSATTGALPLVRLAARNGARNPSRSALTIGLVASATFLIIALSAFQMDPSQRGPDKASGNGGFALVAESGSPIVEDPMSQAREFLQDDELQQLEGVSIYSLRVKPGEDASCRNLYQTKPSRLRVLGVPENMIRRGGFAWAGTAAENEDDEKNPWRLLDSDAGKTADGQPYVPVVLDAATAKWSLHLGGMLGSPIGSTFFIGDDSPEGDASERVPAKVVGLLAGSIFQGDLLMSERHLLKHFPNTTGASFFLVEVPPRDATPPRIDEVRGLLESALVDDGFDAESTGERLASFLAVQNTYLSTFQSLGALGLLLGTFGLATVQLRNVLERRGELALLRAAGFRRRRLAELVMAENAVLLVGGLAIGTLAALVAVLPHLLGGGARIPIGQLALTLAVILIVGLAVGLAAVRATLKAPLIQALRGE